MTAREITAHLQLPAQIPRLPFSSPIGEEVLSPASPEVARKQSSKEALVDPFATPPLAIRNKFLDADGRSRTHQHRHALENNGAAMRSISTLEDAVGSAPSSHGVRGGGISVAERRFSVNKPSRDRSKRHRLKKIGKSNRPGLNVITNFSKPPSTTVRLAGTISSNSQLELQERGNSDINNDGQGTQTRPTMPTQHSGFVSLADLKALNNQPALSSTATVVTKTAETVNKHDKKLRVDPPASALDLVYLPSGPARPMEKCADGEKDGGRTLKNEDVAGLGFQLSNWSNSGTRVDHLRPEDKEQGSWSGFSAISPSDRPIIIGISVPSTLLAEYALTPRSAIPVSGDSSKDVPLTPTIVVTPAKLEAPWSSSPQEKKSSGARRPVSSLYSQATPYITARGREDDVPPVPTLAPGAACLDGTLLPLQPESRVLGKFDASNKLDDRTEKERANPFAMEEVAHEDRELQSVTRGRSLSGESQLGIMGRASVDTVATLRRSRGWWNVITSPFLTRSSTVMTKRSPIEPEKPPELPSVDQAAAIAGERDRRNLEENGLLRSEIYSPEPKSGHTSIWTDMTEWEAQRGKTDGPLHRSPRTSRPGHKPQDSSATIPFVMLGGVSGGAATEYNEACSHDQTNINPFYEDYNHSRASDGRKQLHKRNNGLTRAEVDPSYLSGPRRANNPFFQEPCDRFAAAFGQAVSPRRRADSDTTEIDEDYADLSPNVHEAVAAPVVRAPPPVAAPLRRTSQREVVEKLETKAIPDVQEIPDVHEIRPRHSPSATISQGMHRATPPGPPAYSPPRRTTTFPKYVAVLPPGHRAPARDRRPQIPGPVSAEMQQAPASRDGIMMSGLIPPSSVAEGQTHSTNNDSVNRRAMYPADQITLADLEPPSQVQSKGEGRPQGGEKEKARNKKTTEAPSSRGCFRTRGCLAKSRPASRARRRWYYGLTAALLAMIVLIIVLAITLTRKGDNTPVQSQWLNITGFPPIPTGISTIAQPDAVNENSGCVHPATLWSCALPKEQHQSVAPNDPDQPNFRLEVRFHNGTTTASATPKAKRSYRPVARPVSAGHFVRVQAIRVRDALTDALYSPSPAPPKLEDQMFLGNTTDGNTAPFEGESTPFLISFLSPSPVPSSRLLKRQNADGTNTSNSFPDLESAIPPPDVGRDGSAAAANLLPLPVSQPLRIYNRGQPTEHYGFYTYFDRSIFLKSKALVNSSSTNSESVVDDENGGSEKSGAIVRCTWAQTRFLVQIWTNQGNSSPLLSSPNATQSTTTAQSSSTAGNSSNPTKSSANDFNRPGSFPYPVTVTLDRHGGDITKKMIYCYGMDDNDHLVATEKKLQLETRDFGGTLVNPALGPFGHVNVTTAEGGPGGIDGGTGGCACQWKNFQSRH